MPRLDKIRSKMAVKVAKKARNLDNVTNDEDSGVCRRIQTTIPRSKNNRAVLGAIGIPPGQRAVSHGMAETQPISAKAPKLKVKKEQTEIIRRRRCRPG
jgi:hypothetical protein